MHFLRRNTPTTVKAGPFLSTSDGNTERTGLTIAQADIRLSKNGGAYAQSANVAGATHDENGNYGVPLNTADTDAEGRLSLYIHMGTALPVWERFMVLVEDVFDALVNGTQFLQTINAGAGSETFNYTLTEDDEVTPIADAKVWITTTNSPSANIYAHGYTDAFGKVTFYVDPGTWYVWRVKAGYSFSNPDVEVVS